MRYRVGEIVASAHFHARLQRGLDQSDVSELGRFFSDSCLSPRQFSTFLLVRTTAHRQGWRRQALHSGAASISPHMWYLVTPPRGPIAAHLHVHLGLIARLMASCKADGKLIASLVVHQHGFCHSVRGTPRPGCQNDVLRQAILEELILHLKEIHQPWHTRVMLDEGCRRNAPTESCAPRLQMR